MPHVRVEGSLDDVTVDGDFSVLVSLPDDAAVTLLDVGRTPGRVEVVQRDGTSLNVGSHAHLFGRSHENGDVT
ncbi:hypothetical protein ACFOEP_13155 [Microbacterium amylolyticum]|uniref:hypothetical protein n=1 Tax=Microbacterium amylolyticum TaxID=936337 RepID=UPI003605FEBE